jgi:hypothetical protein
VADCSLLKFNPCKHFDRSIKSSRLSLKKNPPQLPQTETTKTPFEGPTFASNAPALAVAAMAITTQIVDIMGERQS